MTSRADGRFEGVPHAFDAEHPDLGWTISEPIPFDPGEPAPWWARPVTSLLRLYYRHASWKRDHDFCARPGCYRRRHRAKSTFGPHSFCERHDRG